MHRVSFRDFLRLLSCLLSKLLIFWVSSPLSRISWVLTSLSLVLSTSSWASEEIAMRQFLCRPCCRWGLPAWGLGASMQPLHVHTITSYLESWCGSEWLVRPAWPRAINLFTATASKIHGSTHKGITAEYRGEERLKPTSGEILMKNGHTIASAAYTMRRAHGKGTGKEDLGGICPPVCCW